MASYPFKIVYEETGGKIEGYAITGYGLETETKSLIVGKVDYLKKTFEFTEVELDYAKDLDFKDKFCAIHFSGNLIDYGSQKKIQGRFNSQFSNGEKYVFGLIKLTKTPLPPRDKIEVTEEIVAAEVIKAEKVAVTATEDVATPIALPKKKEIVTTVSEEMVTETIMQEKPKMVEPTTHLAKAIAVPIKEPEPEIVPQEIPNQGIAAEEVRVNQPVINKPKRVRIKRDGQKPQQVSKAVSNTRKIETAPVEKKEVLTLENEKTTVVMPKEASISEINGLGKGEVLKVKAQESTISLLIYDEDKADDDVISLYIDDQPVLVNYRVTRRSKKVMFKVFDESVKVRMEAINNGIIGRNTIRVDIIDNDSQIRTLSDLSAGDTATMVFSK